MLAHRLGHEVARMKGGLFTVLALGALVWVFAFIGMLDVAKSVLSSGSGPELPVLLSAAQEEAAVVPDLPALAGATYAEYRDEVFGDERVTEIEYVVTSDLPEVLEHYRAVFAREGWTVHGVAWERGELVYTIDSGLRRGTVEIERRDGLTEIEVELSEPAASAGDR